MGAGRAKLMGSFRLGTRLAGAAVLVFAVYGFSPVGAQPGRPGWDVEVATPLESDDEVVLTLSFFRPGRVMYRTVPGSARSPEDYAAVSGEVVFTGGDSRTIRVPLVDDELAEASGPDFDAQDYEGGAYEVFTVEAWEEPAPDPFPGGAVVRVRVIDDDQPATTADGAGGVTVTTSRPSPATSVGPTSAGGGELTAPPTTATPPAVELASKLASDELRPGTGFALPLDESASSSPNDDDRGSAAGSRLAAVLGATTLGVGGVAWLHRRRRWSATRS